MNLTILKKPLYPEELVILEFVAKFSVVRYSHFTKLFNLHSFDNLSIDKYLSKLKRNQLLTQHQLIIAGELYFTLSIDGAKLFESKVLSELPLLKLNHDMLLIDIYFMYLDEYREHEILTEYYLKRLNGIKIGDKKKVPDLLIRDCLAVELEITEKSHDRLVEIINRYLMDTTLNEVHYYVKSNALARKLISLSGGHSKLKVFIIKVDSDLVEVIPYDNDIPKINNCNDFDLDLYLKS